MGGKGNAFTRAVIKMKKELRRIAGNSWNLKT
jgi:hypothetical protein